MSKVSRRRIHIAPVGPPPARLVLPAKMQKEEKGGEGAAVKSVISKIMAGVYKAFDESVNSVVYPTVFTAMGFAVGVPLLPLCVFWLIRWLCLRKTTSSESV